MRLRRRPSCVRECCPESFRREARTHPRAGFPGRCRRTARYGHGTNQRWTGQSLLSVRIERRLQEHVDQFVRSRANNDGFRVRVAVVPSRSAHSAGVGIGVMMITIERREGFLYKERTTVWVLVLVELYDVVKWHPRRRDARAPRGPDGMASGLDFWRTSRSAQTGSDIFYSTSRYLCRSGCPGLA